MKQGKFSSNLDLISPTPIYLSLKEIWRSKTRFLLVSLVVILITVLVLFIAGLSEGLAQGNREFLEKIEADLLVFQANTDLSLQSSRIANSKLRQIQRVEGVKEVGPVGLSNVSLVFEDGQEALKVNMIGVEPGLPGEPPVIAGAGLDSSRNKETIVDENVAKDRKVKPGDPLIVKSLVGADEEFYDLGVVGVTDSRKYFVQPSIFVPIQVWDQIKPQSEQEARSSSELVFNMAAVQLDDPDDWQQMAQTLEEQVDGIEAVDRKTAYEATPGYTQQRDTLTTQRIFTLLIGVLVIGGFFQIQTLQKVAQVGMLKAIGASNKTVVWAAMLQIVLVNVYGVTVGALGTYVLVQRFPSNIPISFQGTVVVGAIISLLLIGPLSGLLSIRTLLKVEPLTALGLDG
jgi:putative ABC transport system permease protein